MPESYATVTRASPPYYIKEVQLTLLFLGYGVGNTGADGVYGKNTRGAARDFAEDHGLPTDFDDIPEAVVVAICEQWERRQAPIGRPATWHDLTEMASYSTWRRGVRPWSQITGITLHQTGCGPMGEKPERWAKHPSAIDENGRYVYTALKAHVGITPQGRIYHIHPFTAFGWHAQSFSHNTIGFEIDGTFEGIQGDIKTWPKGGKKPCHLSPAQEAAVKDAIRYVAKVLGRYGSTLKNLFAHRQATNDRQPDPGSEIWKKIAIPMMKELNLSDGGPGFVQGKGMPIPEAWDPSRVGIAY